MYIKQHKRKKLTYWVDEREEEERKREREREGGREGRRQRQTFRAWMAAVGSCQSVGIDLEEEGRRRES